MCVLSRCVGVRMACLYSSHCLLFFFFNDTATTEIYTLSLHDALPISITVSRPDLVVSALTGPVRAARGGTAAVTATVKNFAAAPATAPPSSLKFYLSDDQTLDAADIELSPARAGPALGAGDASAPTPT